jgi:hypothetical protein
VFTISHHCEFIDNTIYVLYFNLANFNAGNPRVTPEVTRDVCLLARMMAANLYCSEIEDHV